MMSLFQGIISMFLYDWVWIDRCYIIMSNLVNIFMQNGNETTDILF